MPAKDTITQGQIYEVITDNFLTSGESNKYKMPLQLKKGDKIEIRYPYAWHFRTINNHYLHATPEMILENCKLFGVIWDKVKFNNKAQLEEIIRLRLYDATN